MQILSDFIMDGHSVAACRCCRPGRTYNSCRWDNGSRKWYWQPSWADKYGHRLLATPRACASNARFADESFGLLGVAEGAWVFDSKRSSHRHLPQAGQLG